jgi:hypothetical protein
MKKSEISRELTKLLSVQTEFFSKTEHTQAEFNDFLQSHERTRQLFAELCRLAKIENRIGIQ